MYICIYNSIRHIIILIFIIIVGFYNDRHDNSCLDLNCLHISYKNHNHYYYYNSYSSGAAAAMLFGLKIIHSKKFSANLACMQD